VLGRVGLGTDEAEHPVGRVGVGRPDLVAIDHPMVTVELRARPQGCQVAARPRLAVALAPRDFPEERVANEARLLLVVTLLEQRRCEHARALSHHLPRRLCAAKLLVNDLFLDGIRWLLPAAPAPRHVSVQVPRIDGLQAETGGPLVGTDHGAQEVRLTLRRGRARPILVRPVGVEERSHLLPEPFVLLAVPQIHRVLPNRSLLPKGQRRWTQCP